MFPNNAGASTARSSKVQSCELCSVVYSSPAIRKAHLEGSKHRQMLQRQRRENKYLEQLNQRGPINHHCAPCHYVTENTKDFKLHKTSKRHLKLIGNEAFAVSSTAASRPQDVNIGTDIDFGIIDFGDTKSSFSRTITIANKSAVDQMNLVSIYRIATQLTKKPTKSPFHVNITLPVRIAPAGSITLSVTFNKQGLRHGYHFEQVTLEFDGQVMNRRKTDYYMKLTLRATVGDAELLRILAPTSKYSPLKETPDVFHGKAIERAVRPPSTNHFTVKLGFNMPPKELFKLFEEPFFFDKLSLSAEKYASFFSTLLFAEEYQMNIDIRAYDLHGVPIRPTRGGGAFVLDVPGLAEKRPSILFGDRVHLADSDGGPMTKGWEGIAHEIRDDSVVLQFHPGFESKWLPGSKWNVRFTFSRTSLRRMHDAIKRVCVNNTSLRAEWSPRMFPVRPDNEQRGRKNELVRKTLQQLKLNRKIQNNEDQRRAVAMIFSGVHDHVPFLVFGPPGTGKTLTVAECIFQLIRDQSRSVRILATAPSNASADQIALYLAKCGITETEMIRLNAPTRPREHRSMELMNPELEKFCSVAISMGRPVYAVPSVQELEPFKVIVSTCGAAGILIGIGGSTLGFTHVFVDEAGYGLETEVLLALQMADAPADGRPAGKIILSGDPYQLGPIVRSPLARRLRFGIPFLERLIRTADAVPNNKGCYSVAPGAPFSDFYGVLLRNNYRSHKDIIESPNKLFYGSQLRAEADIDCQSLVNHSVLPTKGLPILFRQVNGKDEREGNSPSWFNALEVSAVIDLVSELLEDRKQGGVEPAQISVITPYRKQVEKIRSGLRKLRDRKPKLPDPTKVVVGTTEFFQGGENRIIIVSTVRTTAENIVSDKKYAMGFIGSAKRFNVAITRAKAMLCVIGDARVLYADECWFEWLRFVKHRRGWIGQEVDLEDNVRQELVVQIGAMSAAEGLTTDFEEDSVIFKGVDNRDIEWVQYE